MENRALGKGLSALIPEKKENISDSAISTLKTLSIQDSSLQPRTDYDDSKLEDLKASIKEKGILQPILVREKNGQYEVVAGERRLRVARVLNLEEIPVIVKNLTDQEALVVALVENIQREDLNPIEEAEAFKKLIEEFSYTQEMVAQAVGKDRATVANLLRLLKLPSVIQKMVYSKKISMGHARALLSIEDESQQRLLAEEIILKGLSVRDIEKLVKKPFIENVESKKTKIVKDYEILSLEGDLSKIFGTKVNVLDKNKKGKLVIEYYSLDDLDRIINLIKK